MLNILFSFFIHIEFILPKMKTKGRMQKHVIKRAKKPFIAEVERGSSVGGGDGAGSKQHPLKKPKYTIQGRRIKIDLPDVVSQGKPERRQSHCSEREDY